MLGARRTLCIFAPSEDLLVAVLWGGFRCDYVSIGVCCKIVGSLGSYCEFLDREDDNARGNLQGNCCRHRLLTDDDVVCLLSSEYKVLLSTGDSLDGEINSDRAGSSFSGILFVFWLDRGTTLATRRVAIL